MAALLLVTALISHVTLHTHAALFTLTGCQRGSECSQCPSAHTTREKNGDKLCCPSCSSASIYYGYTPENWCFCYSGPGDGEGFGGNRRQPHVLNPETNVGVGGLSRPLHEALSIMAEAIESLESRVLRLEYLLEQRSSQQTSEPVNRFGQLNSRPHQTTNGCMGNNFKRIGDSCYYISVSSNKRRNWQEAQNSCEDMGGKLAEPLSTKAYSDLANSLHTERETNGFSFWLGGVYPGLSWFWAYAGTHVSLHQAYWALKDRNGYSVNPGNFDHGRCLHFYHLHNKNEYRFSADECGNEKYYICQLIEKTNKL